jgi:hypothetical protein
MNTPSLYGIDKKDGMLKVFFADDWLHGIFTNSKASKSQ